jgi:hypothetical protein
MGANGDSAPAPLASGSAAAGTDTSAMTAGRDTTDGEGLPPTGGALRALPGSGLATGDLPPVRLVREFKGPTVADLLRDEFAAQLPGQAWSALRRIEVGDFAAAEAVPGGFAPILTGPGGRARRRRWRVAAAIAVLATVAAAVVAALGGGR